MAIPASYTETTLATYLHTVLGATATALGWTVAALNYSEPVNETLAAYGADDIATISGRENIRKLRALARVEAWRAAVQVTAAGFDASMDGASMSRSQIHAQALENLKMAEADAAEWSPAYVVATTAIDYADPYLPADEDGA